MARKTQWFLRAGKLVQKSRSLRLTPEFDGANNPPYIPQAQQAAAGDQPPPRSRQRFAVAVAAWSTAPVLLFTNGFNIPQTDAAPPLERPWAATARAAWEPPAPEPPRRRLVPQGAAVVEAPLFKTDVTGAVSQWFTEAETPRRRLGQIVSVDNPPLLKRAAPQWLDDGYQPQRVRYVVQGAPVADAPPALQRPWLSIALATWAPPDVLVWSNGAEVQGAAPDATQQPYTRRAPSGWGVEWEQPARTRYMVQGALQADAPPPLLRRALPVEDEWQQPPKRVLTPQGAVQADAPPPLLRRTTQVEDEWRQPLKRTLTPQGAVAQVDQPPPLTRNRLRPALAAWDRSLIPLWGIAANQQPVDAPVFSRGWLPVSVAAWEPAPWPAKPRARVVQGTAAQVDAPPPLTRAWLQPALEAWDRKLVPIWGALATPQTATDAPVFSRGWLAEALRAWEPPPWPAKPQPKQAQGTPAQVDSPPPRTLTRYQVAVSAWDRQLIPLWGIASNQAPADTPVFSRGWLDVALRAWEQPTWGGRKRTLAVQGTPAQVDLPPFGLRPWVQIALRAWEPPEYRPQRIKPELQEGPAVSPEKVEWIIRARRRGRR